MQQLFRLNKNRKLHLHHCQFRLYLRLHQSRPLLLFRLLQFLHLPQLILPHTLQPSTPFSTLSQAALPSNRLACSLNTRSQEVIMKNHTKTVITLKAWDNKQPSSTTKSMGNPPCPRCQAQLWTIKSQEALLDSILVRLRRKPRWCNNRRLSTIL